VIISSPTPKRVSPPSWLNARVVVGLLLVVASTALGAYLVGSGRHTDRVLVARHDLAAGTVATAGDFTTQAVHLSDPSRYVSADSPVAGQVLSRPVSSGELVPRAALGAAPALTTIVIPLAPDDAPDLHAGDRIELWLSTKTCPSVALLRDAAVQNVRRSSDGSFGSNPGQDVTLSLDPALARRAVAALALDSATVRAGVLTGGDADEALPDLSGCGGSAP
jgi:hypothetical protein